MLEKGHLVQTRRLTDLVPAHIEVLKRMTVTQPGNLRDLIPIKIQMSETRELFQTRNSRYLVIREIELGQLGAGESRDFDNLIVEKIEIH